MPEPIAGEAYMAGATPGVGIPMTPGPGPPTPGPGSINRLAGGRLYPPVVAPQPTMAAAIAARQQLKIRRNFIGFPPKKTVVCSFSTLPNHRHGRGLLSLLSRPTSCWPTPFGMDPRPSFGLESAARNDRSSVNNVAKRSPVHEQCRGFSIMSRTSQVLVGFARTDSLVKPANPEHEHHILQSHSAVTLEFT